MTCNIEAQTLSLEQFGGNISKYLTYLTNWAIENIKNIPFLDRRVFLRPKNKETVWHIISNSDDRKNKSNRTFSCERAERLTWIPTMLDCINQDCSNFLTWEKEHYNGRTRRYIMCVKEKHLIVLEEYKDIYFLITSFPVNTPSLKRYKEEYDEYLESFKA